MNKTIKILIIAAIVLGAVWLMRLAGQETVSQVNKPTIPNLSTKEGYLQAVRQNYDARSGFTLKETECFYKLLIDTYGLTETRNMDFRALNESAPVDDRMIWAGEKCI